MRDECSAEALIQDVPRCQSVEWRAVRQVRAVRKRDIHVLQASDVGEMCARRAQRESGSRLCRLELQINRNRKRCTELDELVCEMAFRRAQFRNKHAAPGRGLRECEHDTACVIVLYERGLDLQTQSHGAAQQRGRQMRSF